MAIMIINGKIDSIGYYKVEHINEKGKLLC